MKFAISRRFLPSFLGLGITILPLKLQSAETFKSDPAYDVVVYGATPGGIATAVRSAREGLSVLLVSPYEHLGGLVSNGITTMDTLYSGARAPLYDEFREAIYAHYRDTYGEKSQQYKATMPGKSKTKFEAHIGEMLINRLVNAEEKITVIKPYYPVEVERHGARIEAVIFQKMGEDTTFRVSAFAFVDGSYEGDLAATSGVSYRLGRESRNEFGEPHAGKIFMKRASWPPKHVDPEYLAEYRKLRLVHYNRWLDIIKDVSTGEADTAVQGYNLRTVLTNNPANRVAVKKPVNYDRDEIARRLEFDLKWRNDIPEANHPNQKVYINAPEIIGGSREYPEGDWETRQRIWQEHADMTLSLIYFMQNDKSVSERLRKGWSEWGLPKDEFADTGHLPREIYVREARRIKGRSIFTEHDAQLTKTHKRAPIHPDAISITEWFLDSHGCTPEKVKSSLWEGEMLLNNITFPGQIPFGTIIPEGLDNLLVPVCLSATHVGWGAIRLEPTWMSIAEAGAHAIVMAKQSGTTPANVDVDALMRLLAEEGFLLSFFNDVRDLQEEPWYSAVQYLGTQGYFGSYDAKPLDPLTDTLGNAWIAHAVRRAKNNSALSNEEIVEIWNTDQTEGKPVTAGAFSEKLLNALGSNSKTSDSSTLLTKLNINAADELTRGNACRMIFHATAP